MVTQDGCDLDMLATTVTVPPCCPGLSELQISQQECSPDGSTSATFIATTEPANAPGSYAWDFGDGAQAQTTLPSANHVYSSGGAKTVRLRLTPSGGAQCDPATLQRDFDIRRCTTPCPTVSDLQVGERRCVQLSDGSADGSASVNFFAATQPADAPGAYEWDFGDGTSEPPSANGSKSHVYAGGGEKSVRVVFTPRDPKCPPSQSEKTFVLAPCPVVRRRDDESREHVADWCLLAYVFMIFGLGAAVLGVALFGCPLFVNYGIDLRAVYAFGAFLLIAGAILFFLSWLFWVIVCRPSPCEWLRLGWQLALVGFFILTCVAFCAPCFAGGATFAFGAFLLFAALWGWWMYACRPTVCTVYRDFLFILIHISIIEALEIVLGGCVMTPYGGVASALWAGAIALLTAGAYWGTRRYCR